MTGGFVLACERNYHKGTMKPLTLHSRPIDERRRGEDGTESVLVLLSFDYITLRQRVFQERKLQPASKILTQF